MPKPRAVIRSCIRVMLSAGQRMDPGTLRQPGESTDHRRGKGSERAPEFLSLPPKVHLLHPLLKGAHVL